MVLGNVLEAWLICFRAFRRRRSASEARVAAAGELNRQEGPQENQAAKRMRLTDWQEFDLLDDEANIYKQIGPVLLKQDKTEAVMSVNGRLEFIDKEMCA